jgi:ribonuclease-3
VTPGENWSLKYLNYEFSLPELIRQALTHKSKSAGNNERLEFLGDAVLDLVISEALYQQEAAADEGVLSRLRAILVRRETLAKLAAELHLGDMLLLGSGEARSGGHQRQSIMADGLEAVFGAVFLDGGYAAVREVILNIYATRLATLPDAESLKDPKTVLQERLQAQAIGVPVYTVLSEEGPPHARKFEVMCRIEELQLEAKGAATSRKRAEQAAAVTVLEMLDE